MVTPADIRDLDPMSAPRLRYRDGYPDNRPEVRTWVKFLQSTLNGIVGVGGGLDVDGLFGPATDHAVEDLQTMTGLTVDGIVGPNTWRALVAQVTGEAPSTDTLPRLYPIAKAKGEGPVRRMIEAFDRYRTSAEIVAEETGVPVALIFGIGARETLWGTSIYLKPPGPAGRGDHGHGHGLLQIDDRFHEKFIRSGKWSDPEENIRYAISEVWLDYRAYIARRHKLDPLALERATTAAYNCGPGRVVRALNSGRDVDTYTTGRDYARDVFSWAGEFQRSERGAV